MNSLAQFEPATPAMIVGRALDGTSALPLSLDEPFALLGGDRLGPYGIPYLVMHEHQPRFLQWVSDACAKLRADDALWFRAAPLLLTGPKGAGRTHAARRLAASAGLPHAILNMTDPVIAANLAASRRISEALWASPITIAMAATRCANLVVTVLGADRMSDDVAAGLAAMIDPQSCLAWSEDQLGVDVDLGEVTWILQCEDPARVPPAIREQAALVRLDPPPARVESVLGLSILLEVMKDLGVDPDHDGVSWEAVRQRLPDRFRPTAKTLYAEMTSAVVGITRGMSHTSSPFADDEDVPF